MKTYLIAYKDSKTSEIFTKYKNGSTQADAVLSFGLLNSVDDIIAITVMEG